MEIDKIEYKAHTIETHNDETPEDPLTAFDNLGHIIMFLGRNYRVGEYHNWDREELLECIEAGDYMMPVRYSEYAGLRETDEENADGYIIAWEQDIRKEYELPYPESLDSVQEKVNRVLRDEIRIYSAYLMGDVYGYIVKDIDGEIVDSLWGFYGEDDIEYMMNEAKAGIDSDIKRHVEKRKAMAMA